MRNYQTKLITDIRKSAASHRSIVAVLGCGGGKSVIQAEIARLATSKGNRVLFLVHRRELCRQITDTFTAQGVNMELCEVGMVQTISRRLSSQSQECEHDIPNFHIQKESGTTAARPAVRKPAKGRRDGDKEKPALIITDEAHHSTAKTYRKIYDRFPDALLLGFTATPIRLNRGGLGEVYEDLITSVSTRWLIDNNFLADYKYYSVELADTSKLRTRAGEFKADEVAALMNSRAIFGNTVEQWEKLARGKKTICYCAGVAASKATAEAFRAAGHTAYSLDGKTPQEERDSVMERFRSGEITILCNADLFGEGLDVPDCECTVLLRPTQSLTLYIQQAMRSMRYMPGKTAIIIDHVGNCYRHGLPDDPREWTLEPKAKQETVVKIRECRQCFAVYSPTLSKCPYCGAEAEHEKRTVNRKTVDVDLKEIRRQEKIRNTRLQDAEFETWEDIVEFQKAKRYKFAWCLHTAIKYGIAYPPKYNYMVRRFL